MGKKSKKKGSGSNTKTARKERLQERREQQLDNLDQNGQNFEYIQRPVLPGDRVWYIGLLEASDASVHRHRAIVGTVLEESNSVCIRPLIGPGGTRGRLRLGISSDKVFPDFRDLTLRFDVGDRVLCSTYEDGWVPATVTSLWPIDECYTPGSSRLPSAPDDAVICYKCGDITVPRDEDSYIMKLPDSFRFSIGDNVCFNAGKSVLGAKCSRNKITSPWMNATVASVDIHGMDYYAAYECTFNVNGKTYSCDILQDDDEHIAREGADPRSRLFDAIEQNCSRKHLIYLTAAFDIDISAIRDLVVAKAVKSASYSALSWLQHDRRINILHAQDDAGNNLLHKIASSSNATRFIKDAGKASSIDPAPDWKLDITNLRDELSNSLNKNGETWLQVLVRRGDVKALDAALSPNCGLAWCLSYDYAFRKDQLALLAGSIRDSGEATMQCILDSFLSFRKLNQQCHEIQNYYRQSEADLLQKVFRGEDVAFQHDNDALHEADLDHAKSLTRFFLDWHEQPGFNLGGNPFSSLVQKGFLHLFSILYEANDSLFLNESYRIWSKEDRGEYLQPELCSLLLDGPAYETYDCLEVDVFGACIIGSGGPMSQSPMSHHEVKEWERSYYHKCLHQHALKCDLDKCSSWVYHLKGMESYYVDKHARKEFWENKIRLLEDDTNTEGRLGILELLLEQQPNTKLNILEALRHRQCGVVRFMVDKGLVHLEARASMNKQFTKRAPKLQFLENGHIPSSMSTKCFLYFAAVEYDDLQSIQFLWSITEEQCSLVELCDGWNLLHLSAFLGRVEIVAWICKLPVWKRLVDEESHRKPFQNTFALHIAASQGHLFLVNLMLALNVPEVDKKGRLPEQYAKKSKHAFVQDWAAEREIPRTLEKNIKKLLHLINMKETSVEKLKQYVISSKCLDVETWMNCKFFNFGAPGPLGFSFGDVLRECCGSVPNEDFGMWICTRLYFSTSERSFYGSQFWKDESCRNTRVKQLTCNDLITFAIDHGYGDLLKYLSQRLFKNVSCIDPATESFFHALMPSLNGGDFVLEVRAKILHILALQEIADCSYRAVIGLLQQGGQPNELHELLCLCSDAKKVLIEEGVMDFETTPLYFDPRPNDMSSVYIFDVTYDKCHPLDKQLPFREKPPSELAQLHIFLATEGFSDLLKYCVRNLKGWTADMELDVVRIAAFLGHSIIVDHFLSPENKAWISNPSDRFQAAILGMSESCRCRDLSDLLEMAGAQYHPLKEEILAPQDMNDDDFDRQRKKRKQYMEKSLICSVLHGYATETFDGDTDDKNELKTLQLLVNKLNYTHKEILNAIHLVLLSGYDLEWVDKIVDLIQAIFKSLHLQPSMHHEQMQNLCKEIVGSCERRWVRKTDGDPEVMAERRIIKWLSTMASNGIDMQNMVKKSLFPDDVNTFNDHFRALEKRQLHDWSQFDIVKKGGTLEEVQGIINRGALSIYDRDRGGLLLTHLSSAYNRTDILEWLTVAKSMDLNAKDGQGRTALDVAEATKAGLTTRWITEWQAKKSIISFVQRHYHRMLAFRKRERLIRAVTFIQKCHRGHLVRKLYSGALMYRHQESQLFSSIWGHLIHSFTKMLTNTSNWSSIREKVSDIKNVDFVDDDDNYFDDTDERLSKALENSLQIHNDDDEMYSEDNTVNEEALLSPKTHSTITKGCEETNASWLTFQMTREISTFYFDISCSHVVKFLKRGDQKYKSFFIRRMQQLANGERSRILQKRLVGSCSTIYETYLEQKSGFRILWTEEDCDIVIWFVAKHKEVPRLMKLIDDSKNRSARQQMSEALVSELRGNDLLPETTSRKEVLLDVAGNVPMKLYGVHLNSINEIAMKSWTPMLHLTDEERGVVEAEGTVLVLGRSGTGKTVCICNRMEYDLQKYGQDPTFSQLFVARSKRLCRYVSEAVGGCDQNSFCTFEELMYDIETTLSDLEEGAKMFLPSQRIVIRTFIKGSIEAFQSPNGILPIDCFLAVEKLGKNRCRVPVDLRSYIYDLFLKYETYKNELGLWDDCDRMRHVLSRLNKSKATGSSEFDEVSKSKIYVDEIQDYTQLECLLFFYLGGPGGLFLAGDPAQSVVEGTEFRFEEIRSVGFFVAGSERRLIPHKPRIITVNFRSHAGILNTAGAFLDLLFKYFPGNAKQLKKDRGLFQGSRPGVLHKVHLKQLTALLTDTLKGTVVLVHDDAANYWKKALGYALVYGIREAKGLEFKSVMILNFFQELPSSLQKSWRNLLLNREGLDFETKFPLVGTHLKLLYTGITRCIERLFFAETSSSVAGDAVVRWLTTSSVKRVENRGDTLATRNNINDIEAMAMTSDEFLIEGFNNAELAEVPDVDFEQARNSLDRAIWCFEQAGNSDLAAKARTHRKSIQFRLDLNLTDEHDIQENNRSMVEMKGAQLMESLANEGLLYEALNVYYSICPFLSSYAKGELERDFVSKARTVLH
ncbi:hypothetical protein ACHAXR_012566 [Thalassiosira sp. AJA248-18]